jgi:polyphosphate kinase
VAAHSDKNPARIQMKMNALVDPRMIRALYEASQAGVRVDLNVRGICCLRPGVPGVSENIRVVSTLGRFLEHSRVYLFERRDEVRCFIGSADLMPRNLDNRVELLAPVEEPSLLAQVRDLLERCLADNTFAWELEADGTWRRRKVEGRKRWSQGELMERALRRPATHTLSHPSEHHASRRTR